MDGLPRKVESLEVNEADDGLVVYDPAQDQVHHLNPSAAVIFDLCDGVRDADAIATAVAEVFGLDELPLTETRTGLDELVALGLIQAV